MHLCLCRLLKDINHSIQRFEQIRDAIVYNRTNQGDIVEMKKHIRNLEKNCDTLCKMHAFTDQVEAYPCKGINNTWIGISGGHRSKRKRKMAGTVLKTTMRNVEGNCVLSLQNIGTQNVQVLAVALCPKRRRTEFLKVQEQNFDLLCKINSIL